MAYRRHSPGNRRYLHLETPVETYDKGQGEALREVVEIPLPKEMESPGESNRSKGFGELLSLRGIDFGNIQKDEIILLGLIFLLVEEGFKDDFLLLVLIYILLAGSD